MLKPADNTRPHLLTFINGRRHEVGDADAFLTLSDYLRTRLSLTGTKVVCAEGDCGSCSVLIGRRDPDDDTDGLTYRVYDSCILFMYQLDRTHIVTVEGLSQGDQISPVQQAMVDHHGSQCGFCTPGFITTMTGLLEEKGPKPCDALSADTLSCGLSGNLCRCTGYRQIIDAGRAVDASAAPRLSELYPAEPFMEAFLACEGQEVTVVDRTGRVVGLPAGLEAAVDFRSKHPGCTIVAGATDIGVQTNKGKIAPREVLCLSNIDELSAISQSDDQLTLGARTPLRAIEHHVRDRVPEMHGILGVFGSPQIRHAGTIGGNIANASPIADSVPWLLVMNAELDLVGPGGHRTVPINRFYQGYKQFDLKPDELIARVRIPMPTETQTLKLYKVSRRRDLDIATFNAAVLIEADDGLIIREARLAMGGVAPVVMRLPDTEACLTGKPLDESTMREAGEVAYHEIKPLTDVRGTEAYRRQLAANTLLKFYYESAQPVG